jgi:hypothetical protein
MKISLSVEIEHLLNNRIFDRDICKKYPGSEWMFFLYQYCKYKHSLVTCDVALKNVLDKKWDAQDILVIQHMNDKVTEKLLSLGSKPLIIYSLESPLYQGAFYDNASELIAKFKHKLLFYGLLANELEIYNQSQVRFPCFSLSENLFHRKKEKINKMVFVCSNQYIHHKSITKIKSLDDAIWYVRRLISELRHGSKVAKSINHSHCQLHDKRLELITSFLKLDYLDLYGKKWDSYNNLPLKWKNAILPLLGKPKNRSISNKLNTISNYRFCLCVENFEYPGYITEKIIDSIVAQTVPIYFGAPDIQNHVPSDCYIDVRSFANIKSLYDYIQNIDEEHYQKIIIAGQKYLNSDTGKLHSFEGFAANIFNLINLEIEGD